MWVWIKILLVGQRDVELMFTSNNIWYDVWVINSTSLPLKLLYFEWSPPWHFRFHAASADWRLALAVEVRQCPLLSAARDWGLENKEHEERRKSQLWKHLDTLTWQVGQNDCFGRVAPIIVQVMYDTKSIDPRPNQLNNLNVKHRWNTMRPQMKPTIPWWYIVPTSCQLQMAWSLMDIHEFSAYFSLVLCP